MLIKSLEEKILSIRCVIILGVAFIAVPVMTLFGCLKMPSYLFYAFVSIGILLLGFHTIVSPYQHIIKTLFLTLIIVVYLSINTYFIAVGPFFSDPFCLDKLCDDQRNFVMFSISLISFIFTVMSIFFSNGEIVNKKGEEKIYTVDVVKENSNKVYTYTVTIKKKTPQNNNDTKHIEEMSQ